MRQPNQLSAQIICFNCIQDVMKTDYEYIKTRPKHQTTHRTSRKLVSSCLYDKKNEKITSPYIFKYKRIIVQNYSFIDTAFTLVLPGSLKNNHTILRKEKSSKDNKTSLYPHYFDSLMSHTKVNGGSLKEFHYGITSLQYAICKTMSMITADGIFISIWTTSHRLRKSLKKERF